MRSTSQRLPDSPLLLDEGLGTKLIADALRRAGAHVILHKEHFLPGTPDDEWLAVAGTKGWIVLGKDKAVRRRQLEIDAITAASVKLFTLTSANMSGREMASAFVRALPRIAKISASRRGPFVAAVHRDGKVKLLGRSKSPTRPS